MKKFRKILAVALVAALFTTMFAISPQAAEPDGAQAGVSAEDYEISAYNSMGNLIADEIADYQAAGEGTDNAARSYLISDIEISGSTATVSYIAQENCVVLVALYDESTGKLLATGKSYVTKNEHSIDIEIAAEQMPQYFILKGFMLDSGNAPLSDEYYSEIYTAELQELLKMDADDFDSDDVLNLDSDTATNFGVYSDAVTKLQSDGAVNTLESADEVNNTYVFSNADEKLTSLQAGDIFVCDDDPENVVIVKIGAISVDGTSVTVTAEETSLDEVFDYVKIEGNNGLEKAEVDESTMSDGVTYDGCIERETEPQTQSVTLSSGIISSGVVDIDAENKYKHKFDVLKDGIKDDDDKPLKGEVSGSVGFYGNAELKIYISRSKKLVSFDLALGTEYEVSITGEYEDKLKFAKFTIPVAGKAVGVTIEPGVFFKCSAELSLTFGTETSVGFMYASGKGFQDTSREPEAKSEFSLEGEIFFGLYVDVAVEVIDDDIGEAGVECELGFRVKGTATSVDSEIEGVTIKHTCNKCVSGDISAVLKIKPFVKILRKNLVESKENAFELAIKLTDWYYSFDHDIGGLNVCPYITFTVPIKVMKDGQPVEDAEFSEYLAPLGYLGATNSYGVLNVCLNGTSTGLYQVWIEKGGEKSIVQVYIDGVEDVQFLEDGKWCSIAFSDNFDGSCYVVELGKKTSGDDPDPTDPTDPTEPAVTVVASGSCGDQGDNIKWEFLSDGTLNLNGSGNMHNYRHTYVYGEEFDYTPWHSFADQVLQVNISEGITSVGSFAFADCVNLKYIYIPDGVTLIQWAAFAGSGLNGIRLPDSVNNINDAAFRGCDNLTITIPEGVGIVWDSTFKWCDNLHLTLPSTIKTVNTDAFVEANGVVYFKGDQPYFNSPFLYTYMTFYYPAGNETWSNFNHDCYWYKITACPYDYEKNEVVSSGNALDSSSLTSATLAKSTAQVNTVNSEFGNLVAGGDYIIAAVRDKAAQDILSADNLLYIDQLKADENGRVAAAIPLADDSVTYEIVLFGAENTVAGDVSGDGNVTVSDAILIQKYIAGLIELSDEKKSTADLNGDSSVTVSDAIILQKYVANIITLL